MCCRCHRRFVASTQCTRNIIICGCLSVCLSVWCNPYQFTMSVWLRYYIIKNVSLNEWWHRIVKATANKLYATSGCMGKKNANVAAAAKVNLLLFAMYWRCNIAYCGRKTIERCHFKFIRCWRCCCIETCSATHLSFRVAIKLPYKNTTTTTTTSKYTSETNGMASCEANKVHVMLCWRCGMNDDCLCTRRVWECSEAIVNKIISWPAHEHTRIVKGGARIYCEFDGKVARKKRIAWDRENCNVTKLLCELPIKNWTQVGTHSHINNHAVM